MMQMCIPLFGRGKQPKTNVKIERVKGNGFKDVAGMAQLKGKLTRNFVDIVQNRELAAQFQITPPNGILLWGPPGTDKTFISRKLAEKNVFVVATTNRIDAIDPAIIRKGRMDEVIYVGLPDEDARKELLEIDLLKRPHEEIDTEHIVELTNGYSSSDISFIVKECARCSFEESVKAKQLVKINQTLLEKTIAGTRPSVTADELRQFERTKELFSKGRKSERLRIGF